MMEQQVEETVILPWHKTNELTLADISPGRNPLSLATCETSVIEDGGDAKQLARTSIDNERKLDHGRAAINLVLDDPRNLDASLRNAMVNSAGHDSRQQAFIPVGDLDRIINTGARWELEKSSIYPVEYYYHQICGKHEGRSPQDGKITLTSRRRIFAILVLIKQTRAIVDVVKDGIYDWDLPLELDGSSHPGFPRLVRKRTGEAPHPVSFSGTWLPYQQDIFFRCQWQLSSPYFEMRTGEGAKINHYRLDPYTVLPITDMSDPHTDRHGGFGRVSKIKIHPAHRSKESIESESWLALKKLNNGTEEQFNKEVRTLKRLRIDHHHIIPLLATYQIGPEYYLLFPWADGGNLDDFFKSYPKADFPPRDPKLSKWLAYQLWGLSDALASIHICELNPTAKDMYSFGSRDARKIYGAHGDLKPENILWFKENGTNNGERSVGTLGAFKIADFGLTSFHGLDSRSKFMPAGFSKTYRAPEYDIIGRVSQKYDMWSLGCVWIELATWYLLGSDAVATFRTERLEETVPHIQEDTFYSLPSHPDYNQEGRATEKMSVRDHFDMLRNLPGCTEFLLELIDFVDRHLLRMKPANRCEPRELIHFASSIRQKCHRDSKYCLERITPLRVRQDTELSELTSPHLPRSSINLNTSLQALSVENDISAAHLVPPNFLDLTDGTSFVGSAKLALETRQRERDRSISTVREVDTPTTPSQVTSGQTSADTASTLKFSNTEEDNDHNTSADIVAMLPSTLQRGSKAKLPNPVRETKPSSFYRHSGQALSRINDEATQNETYSVSETCFSFSRVKEVVTLKWSTFFRR